jgi:carboxylesterase type B
MRGEWDPWIEGVIVGTCEDEGALFVFADENVNSSLGISKLLKRYPGMVAARARALYPDNKGDKYDLTKAPLAQFTADWTFNVPVFELAKTMAGKQNTKTGHPCKLWMYRYRQPIRKLMFNGKSKFNFGVTHAMDLPVTFDVEQLWEEGDGAAGTAPVMNAMWAAFAAKGTPGSDWTPFSPDAPSWLVFSPGGKVHNERVEAFYSERTRFLSELLIRREQLAADSGLVKTEKRGSVL